MKTRKPQWLVAAIAVAWQPILNPQPVMSQVGINTVTPDPSSILDMVSTNQGMLVSRMTAAERNAIASPARGLMVFVTTDSAFYYNNGAPSAPNWVRFMAGSGSSGGWALTGNAGTDSSTNFLGTTDAQPLRFMTNNTQRMIVSSTGNVGIGTTSPSTRLHVSGGQLTIQHSDDPIILERYIATTTGPAIFLRKSRNATIGLHTIVQNGDELGGTVWDGSDGTAFVRTASILAQIDETPGVNDMPGRLLFSTTADGAASPTERMRITQAGNVGIGTTGPLSRLHTRVGLDRNIRIDTTLELTTGIGLNAFNDANSVHVPLEFSASQFLFRVGNVGIGTTASGAKLHVYADTAKIPLRVQVVDTTGGTAVTREVLYGSTTGNVGIGTTGPGVNLHIEKNQAGGVIIRARNLNAGGVGNLAHSGLQLGNDGSVNQGGIAVFGSTIEETDNYKRLATYIYNNAPNSGVDIFAESGTGSRIRLGTAGSERVRIDNAGNVGIGTTVPGVKLEVGYGTGTQLKVAGGGGGDLQQGGQIQLTTTSAGATNPSKFIRVLTDGTLQVVNSAYTVGLFAIMDNGNVGIGTGGPNSKFQVAGGAMYTSTAGEGLILKSPDGLTCRKVTIDNTGALVLTPIACP